MSRTLRFYVFYGSSNRLLPVVVTPFGPRNSKTCGIFFFFFDFRFSVFNRTRPRPVPDNDKMTRFTSGRQFSAYASKHTKRTSYATRRRNTCTPVEHNVIITLILVEHTQHGYYFIVDPIQKHNSTRIIPIKYRCTILYTRAFR